MLGLCQNLQIKICFKDTAIIVIWSELYRTVVCAPILKISHKDANPLTDIITASST